MMLFWFSVDDMIVFIEWIFWVLRFGCLIIYGVFDNIFIWWDNSSMVCLGW